MTRRERWGGGPSRELRTADVGGVPPYDLAGLEARCWSLAGERMKQDPFLDVAVVTPAALELVEYLSDAVDEPVADALADPELAARALDLELDEWDLLARALLRWAGQEAAGEATRALDAADEAPPLRRAELRQWVLRKGIRERLDDPLRRAAALAASPGDRYRMMVNATMRDALAGRVPRLGPGVLDAVRAYLGWAAGRRALATRRRETWARPGGSRAVDDAAARLRALLDDLREVPPPALPADVVRIGPTEDHLGWAARARSVAGVSGAGVAWISLVERASRGEGERALSALDQDPRTDRGLLRLCAEHALDALLDPEHPEQAAVRAAIERPRWTFLLADLERRLTDVREDSPFEPDERLVWRVDVSATTLAPAVQKRRGRGWTRGRAVEPRWVLERPGALDPRDRRVAEALKPRRWIGDAPATGVALEALVGHPRVVLADRPKVGLRVRRGAVEVRLVERAAGTTARFALVATGAPDAVFEPHALIERLVGEGHVALYDPEVEALTVAPLPAAVRELALACARWEAAIPPEGDEALLALLRRLPETTGVELPPRLRGARVEPDLRPVIRLEPLPGGTLRAELWARPLPGGPLHPPGEGPAHLVGVRDGRRVHVLRDRDAERRAADQATATLGLGAGVDDGARAVRFDDPQRALDVVAALRASPEVATAEWPGDAWDVVGTASLAATRVRVAGTADWFGVGGEVRVDEHRVELAELVRALRDGRRYVALGPGRFVAIEERLRAALAQADGVVFEERGALRIAPEGLAALSAAIPEEQLETDATVDAMRARLAAASAAEPEVPAGLEAELRGYQREGVRWLLRLARWAGGACLADDMGLGKTLQAIALLVERAPLGPTLVVAPTSLGEGWAREVARFAPRALRTKRYRGPDRAAALAGLGPGDVLITSYDILARDVEELSAVELGTLVVDEAHALKNPRAQRTRAARRLRAGFRLGLTGTPVENHLGELHSLFGVLVPGLLGPWDHFRARFAAPIERDGDLARREALAALLRPFLLRRRKDQVAPELPPRVDVIHTVELSADERARYEAERRAAVDALSAAAEGRKGRFSVLAALTRLRRMACHPALVDPEAEGGSAKLDATLALCRDLAAEGRRALLFSQFTGHLALVRRGLIDLGYAPLTLEGSTPAPKRAELVDAFQAGRAPFFLISLKAGGTGLNLTAADTVIHLDPWWNPAAEDQASDRTHRIGQDQPVTVIRLVAEDTVEEAVLTLHERKRELARGVLEGSDAAATLDVDELVALLDG